MSTQGITAPPTAGANLPTVGTGAPQTTALPPTPGQVTTAPSPTGLINSAATSAPQTNATGQPTQPGQGAQPNPQPVSATPAPATSYTPQAFTVNPATQTVAGQLSNIIASGSPLMEQATANANMQMNQRGLINSSQAITAGQSAVIAAATPIATADAATYNAAMTNTVQAVNTAAGANAGTATQQAIAAIQANTSLSNQQQQDATTKLVAAIQSNTSLSNQQQQDLTNVAIQASQVNLQTYLGQLSANTTLTSQQIATQASAAIAAANNVSAQAIAGIQANTSLTVEQQQTASAQIIAAMNNTNAQTVQQLQNQGNLDAIQANGVINEQITNLTDANKTLLQTSSGAATLYNQALTNMANTIGNPNLAPANVATSLNDQVAQLNSALNALSAIGNTPGIDESLDFSTPAGVTNANTQPKVAA